jgi:2-C-methyl-D-erythritol 4-phosphate cytidylyltransferase
MADFSVLLVTAAPPGHAVEAGGAFVKIDGREALLRSAELFLNRPNIKQIQIVFVADSLDACKKKYGGHLGFSGIKVVSGGQKWMEQVAAGAATLAAEISHVIVHDAARPAVSYCDIDALMEAAEAHPVAALTAPLRTAVIELDEGGNPIAYHRSDKYVQLLTPQAFARERFVQMADSRQEPHASEVHLVKGSPLNVRVSGGGDAGLVKQMISMLPRPKVKAPSSPFEEAQW